jgi:hypothetical protein
VNREVDRSVVVASFDPEEFRPRGLHPQSPWGYSEPDALSLLVDARTDDERFRYEEDIVRANRAEHATMSQGVETVDANRV